MDEWGMAIMQLKGKGSKQEEILHQKAKLR